MMIDHLIQSFRMRFQPDGHHSRPYASNRAAKRDAARGDYLQNYRRGSYHLTISTPGISHNSFLDVRLLGRADSSGINIWPKDVQATTPHARILSVVTAYARAFFDKYVRQIPAPLLETAPAMQDVEIRRYGAAAK